MVKSRGEAKGSSQPADQTQIEFQILATLSRDQPIPILEKKKKKDT
jgi:hypothetical protein